MSKLIINFWGGTRNLKFLGKRHNWQFLVSIIIGYSFFVMGSTYAYYFFNGEDTSILTGDLGEARIDLTVERVVPDTDMPLVPLLDAALGNAIKGNGGVSACIDSNNNLSCEVYKITIHNPSTTNLELTGDVTLTASGEGNIYNNLKWELLAGVDKRKTVYESYGIGTNILEDKLFLEVGDTRIYYIAIWISENGTDQRETDKGQYGGIVEFRTSSGLGVTAVFGTIDDNYCINNNITNLGDCILISEKYSNTVDAAKVYISNKVADFTNPSPIITYTKKIENNVTNTNDIFSVSKKVYVGDSYTFDSQTGRYTLTNATLKNIDEAVSDENTVYYVVNNSSNNYSTTMYVVYNVITTTSNNVNKYHVTNADIYSRNMETQNISEKGLYLAEDNYGDSYYYRGKVQNNYVSFAGYIWRIMRINGNGSIRLIYSGTSTSDTGSDTSIGSSAYNSSNTDATFSGYKYGLSKTLQHTTATNLSYSNLKSTTVYYFGDNYINDDSTKKLFISGNTTSGTLKEIWKSGDSNYIYTCFNTSLTEGCTTLIEIKSYSGETSVSVNYHSYLSESYEATYTDEYDSTIKQIVDSWYKTNIEEKGYSSYIEDSIFCNDRGIYSGDGFSLNRTTFYQAYNRNYTNKIPSLLCSRQNDQFTVSVDDMIGNGELTYPVGLLSMDEAVYAGGKHNTLNEFYYLYTGQKYWTMTPAYFSSVSAALTLWSIDNEGRLYPWDGTNTSKGVRPVINLKSNIEITSGNGTATAPYIVKTS